MRERKSRRNCLRAAVPAPLLIHFYCRERSARAWREVDRADSDRTDWSPAIRRVKVDQADRDRAEDVAGPAVADQEAEDPAERAALADPVAEAALSAELLAEAVRVAAESLQAAGAAD